METRVIYDGTVEAAGRNLSETFTGGQFLYFDAGLGDAESLDLGVSLIALLPGLNGTIPRLWDDLGILNTNQLIPIPREVSESGFEFYLGLGTSVDQPNFRAYVIYSEVSQELLGQKLDGLQEDLNAVLENQTTAFNLQVATAANAIAQNTAIGIIGTGLIPITAGVTSPVPLLLSSSTLPLLLP